MQINKIYIQNFRNYDHSEIIFSPFLNFFIGENATGKSNLLEAIGYFILYRSFRNLKDIDLIQWNKDFFYLKLETFDNSLINSQKDTYEVGVQKIYQTVRKKVKKNNKKINKISELFGSILGVFFIPEDIIYTESLTSRRNFFDLLFSTIDFEYFSLFNEYQRCLKQRNELLRRIQEKKSQISELDFWDYRLIEIGKKIFQKRIMYLKDLEVLLQNRILEISNQKDYVAIVYDQNLLESYERFFFNHRIKDIQTGTTNFGIHRDKINFYDKNQKEILLSFSQGQKRTIALSLKLAQYDFYKKIYNKKPILFIDDVIRELDQNRRKYFLKLLLECGQAFFTTPNFEEDMNIFKKLQDKECKIFKILNGDIHNEF